MNAGLRILAPGLLTTVQDIGRPGHQRLGIPVSGALDPVSLRAANALVGNAPGAGALEVAHVGPTFVVDADDVRLSFVGAEAPIDILPEIGASSGRRIQPMRSVHLQRGEVVQIGSLMAVPYSTWRSKAASISSPYWVAFRRTSAAASAAGRVARW